MNKYHVLLFLFISYFILVFFLFFRVLPIRVPLIATDEVQYRLLAENIYRYGRFLLRGHFPTTIAPLYSTILALWKFIPLRLEQSSFFQSLNALIFASALFPLYLLARFLSIPSLTAIGLSILCLLIPHSFYVATCMSENLYFPLALSFIYLVFYLCEYPNIKISCLTAFIGSALVLTKSSGAFLLLSFLLFLPLITPSRKKLIYLGPLTLILSFIIYLPWLLYKYHTLGNNTINTFGVYSNNWRTIWESLFSLKSIRFLCIYISDFIFATGFISVPLVITYYITKRPHKHQFQFWYLFILSLTLIIVASLFSGLNTGWLRERHMFILFPIYILFLFQIWSQCSRKDLLSLVPWILVFLLLSALLIGLYDFTTASPIMESPWVNLITASFSVLHISPKIIYHYFPYFLLPFFLLVLILTILNNRLILSLWFIFFFFLPSTITLSTMHQWSKKILDLPQTAIIYWIKNNIGTGHQLLITGRHAYFEPTFLQLNLDKKLVKWNESFFLNYPFLYRLEMAGLYDIRIIDSLDELQDFLTKNKEGILLTSLILKDKKPLSSFGPLYLYKISKLPHFIYKTKFDPYWFFTLIGKYRLKDNFHRRIEASNPGWAVYGPYIPLPQGDYQVIYFLDCLKQSSLILDVYANSLGTLARKELTCYKEGTRPSLTFEVKEPKAKYEFRIFLKRGGFIFNGAMLSSKDKET